MKKTGTGGQKSDSERLSMAPMSALICRAGVVTSDTLVTIHKGDQ
jgi:hypothetical protein